MKIRTMFLSTAKRVVVRTVRGFDTEGSGLKALVGDDVFIGYDVGGSLLELDVCTGDGSLVYVHVEDERGGVEGAVFEPLEGEGSLGITLDHALVSAFGGLLVSSGEHAAEGGAHFLAAGVLE